MKRLLVILLVLLPFLSKAQYGVVNINSVYFEQYIHPPLIDNSLNREVLGSTAATACILKVNTENGECMLNEVAQRYEVAENDSVKIFGTAFMVNYAFGTQVFYDTITISILSADLTNTIYSQSFISSGTTNEVVSQYISQSGFNGFGMPVVECIFNDTITLYEDFYIAYENKGHCNNMHNMCLTFMFLSEYKWQPGYGNNYCTPYACNSKYKPYVKLCNDSRANWCYVDDVTNWATSYESVAKYHLPTNSYCDTVVCAALGIMPIQTLRDTVSDTLNSGIVSVELLEECTELFPNPAKDVLNINSAYAIKEVEIYDALNRLVKRRKVNNKNIQIDISNLSAGSYVVKINTAKGSVKKKLIVE